MKYLLVAFLPLILASCATKEDELITYDEQKLMAQSADYFEQMRENDFDTFHSNFDSKLASALKKDDLIKAYNDSIAPLGEFKNFIKSDYELVDNFLVTRISYAYQNQNLLFTVTYDKDKVAGLFFSYFEDDKEEVLKAGEVKVKVGSLKDNQLDGILTLPTTTNEKAPLVIIVHGSGPTDKDGTVLMNKPYKDIAEGLAKEGIATLRYDKRFKTYPELSLNNPTSLTIDEEVMDDLYSTIELMKKDSRIDSNNIFIVGHSLGGMLAPSIAANRDDVKGIISLNGSPRRLSEILKDQFQALIDEAKESITTDVEKAALAKQEAEINRLFKVFDQDLTKIDKNTPMPLNLPVSYWISLDALQAKNFVDEIDKPFFIMQGSADFQVSPKKDYEKYVELFKDKANVKSKLYDNLNHLMMKSNGAMNATEYQIKANVNQEVIKDIANFIKENL